MSKPHFLFADFETGGLNGRIANGQLGMEYYPLLEMAFIVTDINLKEIGEPLRLVIHQSEEMIERCHPWAIKTHTESGLLEEVRKSTLSLESAENRVLSYLKAMGVEQYDRKRRTGLIFAGSSIMLDRCFMMAQMETLHEFLHYRQVDVSALALASRAWLPNLEEDALRHKKYTHCALADIRESIEELRVYKRGLFFS